VALESLRWRAAVKCSSGRRRAAWRGKGKPAQGWEAAGQGPRRHVHRCRGVLDRQGRRTWPGSGAGVRQRRSRGGRERER
jgi:hypothetical protein